MMTSTAYSEENEDHLVVHFLIAGFAGVLRGWWKNMLNENERQYIQTSTNEEGEQNAVHILIYAITNTSLKILGSSKKEVLKYFKTYDAKH